VVWWIYLVNGNEKTLGTGVSRISRFVVLFCCFFFSSFSFGHRSFFFRFFFPFGFVLSLVLSMSHNSLPSCFPPARNLTFFSRVAFDPAHPSCVCGTTLPRHVFACTLFFPSLVSLLLLLLWGWFRLVLCFCFFLFFSLDKCSY
jgi:hypothetical protein